MNKNILKKGINMGIHLQNAACRIFKSTKLNHSYIEAISNSIDSIKERLQLEKQFTPQIDIIFTANNDKIESIKVIDNGVGFNDKNITSFNTIFSDNKSLIGGKGCGHLSWIVEAEQAEINSIYKDNTGQYYSRIFKFDKDYFEYDNTNTTSVINNSEYKTEVTLINIKDNRKINHKVLMNNIVSTFIMDFIENTIVFNICFNDENISLNEYFKNNIIDFTEDNDFVADIANKKINNKINLKIIKVAENLIKESKIVLAAHNRKIVDIGLNKYIPFLPSVFLHENGNQYCIVLWIYSDVLDERVDDNRLSFCNIGENRNNSIEDYEPVFITYDELFYNIKKELNKIFTDDINRLTIQKQISLRKIVETEPCLHYIVNNKNIVSQITEDDLKSQDMLLDKLTTLYRKEKTTINKTITRAREFYKEEKNYEKFFEILKNNISTITDIASHELSQYVLYRKVIIEIFKDFTLFNIENNKIENEDIFHQIIFPMRKEDNVLNNHIDYYQHNLWIVDEKLSFYYAIASDKQFSKIGFIDNISNKRADLLFALTNNKDDISSFVLVEFKKPTRDNYTSGDNPIDQILDYVNIIRNGKFNIIKSKNETQYSDTLELDANIPIYAYIIADITPTLQEVAERYSLYFYKGQSGIQYIYGIIKNTYITIKPYNTLLKDAQLNNKAFFDMLGL